MNNENQYEDILETCVEQIANGQSSLEECLARFPNYAAELEPILSAATRLKRVRDVKPPPFLRARIHAQITQTIETNPRRRRGLPTFFWRMALNVSVLVLAIVMTNTVFAQSALPGDALYRWKLTSEHVWRVITTDPLGTDLRLADRRVDEYLAVSKDDSRRARVLLGYNELLVRFQAEEDEADRQRILTALKSQQDSLKKVGLSIPELDRYFSGGAIETDGEFQIATPEDPITRPSP
jgi:hypothetical protein